MLGFSLSSSKEKASPESRSHSSIPFVKQFTPPPHTHTPALLSRCSRALGVYITELKAASVVFAGWGKPCFGMGGRKQQWGEVLVTFSKTSFNVHSPEERHASSGTSCPVQTGFVNWPHANRVVPSTEGTLNPQLLKRRQNWLAGVSFPCNTFYFVSC